MTTPSKVVSSISVFLLLLFPGVSSASSVLYDNGPDALSFSTADFISFSQGATPLLVDNEVTDSFTLTATSTLTAIRFAELTSSPTGGPAVPMFLNYHIGTTPFGTIISGPNAFAGTALVESTFIGSSGSLQDYRAQFPLPPNEVVLQPGTYYLTLLAANDTSPSTMGLFKDYWGLTDATSGDAMFRSIDSGTGVTLMGDLNNEPSFQIFGVLGAPPTNAPEPGTLGLLAGGLLLLALSRRCAPRLGRT